MEDKKRLSLDLDTELAEKLEERVKKFGITKTRYITDLMVMDLYKTDVNPRLRFVQKTIRREHERETI